MANTFKNDVFRSGNFIGNAVVAAFGILIALSVAGIFGSGWMILSPDSSIEIAPGEFVETGTFIVSISAILQLGVRVICVVLFLTWLYRVFRNLPAIGARNLEFSPGWAIGWWFIPFANLVQPYKVVKELYGESRQAILREGAVDVFEVSTENVGLWWGAFLLSMFTLRISDAMAGSDTVEPSRYFPVAYLAGQILFAVAAGLVMVIIRNVNSWQYQAFENRKPLDTLLPPPPPTFDQSE
jgi:hypothetical protein